LAADETNTPPEAVLIRVVAEELDHEQETEEPTVDVR